jgi:flagellar biosynthetic protein FliR
MSGLNDFIGTLNATLFPQHDFKSHLLVFVLVVLRLLTLVHTSGLFHAKHVPAQLRLGIAFVLTLGLWPYIPKELDVFADMSPFLFSLLAMKEAAIGFLMGSLIAAILTAAQTAGDFIDIFRGANQIQLMSPDTSDRVSAFSNFLHLLSVVLFFSLGLHELLINAMVKSYQHFALEPKFISNVFGPMPAGTQPLSHWVFLSIDFLANAFQMAVQIAFPVIMIALVIELGFGLINRTAPQINAYFLSLPAKSLVSVLVLLLALPLLFKQLELYMTNIISRVSW